MRPLFGVPQTGISNSSSSNSDPTDRRINALVRHLAESSSSAMADSLSASVTSSLHSDSVFAHVVRAPEDPILGVFFFLCPFRSIAVGLSFVAVLINLLSSFISLFGCELVQRISFSFFRFFRFFRFLLVLLVFLRWSIF